MISSAPPVLPRFTYGFDDRVPRGASTFYGAQHLLALTGLWVFPLTLGTALDLDNALVARIIQGCFLLTGLVTVLSSSKILRLPIVQGPTAALLVALIATAHTYDPGTAFGSMAVAGVLSVLLAIPVARLGVYGHIASFVASPIVFGTMFLVLGAQLAGIGVAGWFGEQGSPGYGFPSLTVALWALGTVLVALVFGGRTLLKRGALVWGVTGGTFVAGLLGLWVLPDLSSFPIVGPPQFLPFGFGVEPAAVALMMIGFLQAASESMGVYGLLGRWQGRPLGVDRSNRGLCVEFLGSAVGALFGGIGTTSYPENVGILRVTRVASRYVTMVAGVLAIVLAFLPRLALFLANLPSPALSAAATVLFGVIAFSGVQQLSNVAWDDLNLAVAATGFIVPLGLQFIPDDIVDRMSPGVSSVLTSPMMMSAILLLVLHPLVNGLVRPRLRRSRFAPEPVEDPLRPLAGAERA